MLLFSNAHPILSPIKGRLARLPSPANLRSWWNFGSLLGLCLGIQLITGFFLALFYTNFTLEAFTRVSHLEQDVTLSWLLRALHANGASFFFFCLYFHTARGVYYHSFVNHLTWAVGVAIFLVTIATAFLGYVLPWGQMSFWGTAVITNLVSAVPYIGENTVIWLWGGMAVSGPTLTRFFAFHFLTPFIIAAMRIVHLVFLHQSGSSNPLGLSSNYAKLPFQPYFSSKDLFGIFCLWGLIAILVLINPWILGDPENFIMANPLATPIHIQPEWYFLFAYAILRSIPNKLGGVIALGIAILILYSFLLRPIRSMKGASFYGINKAYFWTLVSRVLLMTWIGARPVEQPYILLGQFLTAYYFLFYLLYSYGLQTWDSILGAFNWKTYLTLKIRALICHS